MSPPGIVGQAVVHEVRHDQRPLSNLAKMGDEGWARAVQFIERFLASTQKMCWVYELLWHSHEIGRLLVRQAANSCCPLFVLPFPNSVWRLACYRCMWHSKVLRNATSAKHNQLTRLLIDLYWNYDHQPSSTVEAVCSPSQCPDRNSTAITN